jgi:DNA primase
LSSHSTNSDRDRVLAATDILSVIGEVIALRPKGREHVGLCPFHEDRSPSMAVVTHKTGFGGSGFYKCFACGAAGNAIDFVMNYHRMEFIEALKFLAAKAGVELTPYQAARPRREGEPTRDDVMRANALAEKFFRRVYADADRGAKARAEVERRAFGAEIVEGFSIGAASARSDALVEGVQKAIRAAGSDYPPFEAFVQAGVIRPARTGGGYIDLLRERLVFPICDELGRPIAFGGRKLDPEQEPKYLNSPESPVFHKSRALYGIHRAKRTIVERKQAIVTEGYTDVIACHKAGFTNAVATLGTALTRDHARVLRRMADSVVLLFDGDEAGQKAADRALEVFFSESIDIKICVLPDNLDPDDLLRQEGGDARFAEALRRSSDALAFMASRIRRQIEGRGLSARQLAIEQTTAKFVDLGLNAMSGLRRQLVLQSMAELFGVAPSDLDRLAKSLRPRGTGPVAESNPTVGRTQDEFLTPHSGSSIIEVQAFPGSAARRRARILAERRLLGLLCVDPATASVAVNVAGAGMLPLAEALSPDEFADVRYSAIFAVIREASESGHAISFDGLLGELADADVKRLASDLYLFGVEVLRAASVQTGVGGAGRTVSEEVVVSWDDLESLARREKFRAELAPAPEFDRTQDGSPNKQVHEHVQEHVQAHSTSHHTREPERALSTSSTKSIPESVQSRTSIPSGIDPKSEPAAFAQELGDFVARTSNAASSSHPSSDFEPRFRSLDSTGSEPVQPECDQRPSVDLPNDDLCHDERSESDQPRDDEHNHDPRTPTPTDEEQSSHEPKHEPNHELKGAVERLARLRERTHDVTVVSALFRRRSNSSDADSGRSSNT